MRMDRDNTLLISTNNYPTQLITQLSGNVKELKRDLRIFFDNLFLLALTIFNVFSVSADRGEVKADYNDHV